MSSLTYKLPPDTLLDFKFRSICPSCKQKFSPGESTTFDKLTFWDENLGKMRSQLIPYHEDCIDKETQKKIIV